MRIKELRKKRGMTQQALADRIGIHLTNLNKIENGKSAPDLSRFAQIAEALGVSVGDLFAGGEVAPEEPRRVSLEEEWQEERQEFQRFETTGVWSEEFGYRPTIEGAIPEIDVEAGAGDGRIGEVITLPMGEESYSGHKVIAEWLLPEDYLRHELHTNVNRTLVMNVIGDSMIPTYQPGDRVLIDLTQKQMNTDTVYLIGDGNSPPQIKRLQRVLFSEPAEVRVISDNPANENVTALLERVLIYGRVVGVVSRR